MGKVFICHAMQDDAVANRIYERLTAAGIRAWLDNVEIMPEADWLVQVETAVKESSHGLFLLSPSAVRSPAAMSEYHQLLQQDKPMFVALVEPLTDAELPYYLRDVAYCDLTEDFEAGMKCLVRLVQSESAHLAPHGLSQSEGRDITITLQANLRDLDNDKFIDLIARLVDVGIKDIKVINVTAG
jgi:hypothetical protein